MNRSNVVQTIASALDAMRRCESRAKPGNDGADHWSSMARHHRDSVESVVSRYLPSGSGFDAGTKLDFDASRPDRLVFTTSFHHMNDTGMYDGWTEHRVIVVPSFIGHFSLRVSGKDRNGIKDYIADVFHHALQETVRWTYQTASVVGGWQTEVKETGQRIGPIFNASTECWAWQAANLPRD